jgi:chromosome segregation ATPase
MGKNRDLKKRIESLEERIREHRAKISSERRKAHPDDGLIRFWEREISNYSDEIERKYRRLRRDW